LGGEHLQTLTMANNLAGAYESAGELDQAVVLYELCGSRTRPLGLTCGFRPQVRIR
jgi:hypothetical protein